MTDRDDVAVRVSQLLRDSLYIEARAGEPLDLVDSGMLDSSGFIELFVLLEREFGIKIGSDDMDIDNFASVDRIASFVIVKQRASG